MTELASEGFSKTYPARPANIQALEAVLDPFNKPIDRNPEDNVAAAGPIPRRSEKVCVFFQLLYWGGSPILIARDPPQYIDRTGVRI